MNFDGKVALVTGGNSGIGRASALAFARHGASVVIAARRVDRGEAVATEIRESGGEAIFVPTDVSVSEDIQQVVATSVSTFGRLDFAFNNAGTLPTQAPMHEVDEATWDRVMAVKLKGVWLCMKYEIEQMLNQGGGVIVNDSSAGGLRGTRNWSPYGASKHGVIGLTKSAALEYVQQGIRVNVVCPGFVDTEMTQSFYGGIAGRDEISSGQPAGRHGDPDEVAEAVVWLCSDAASFVNGVSLPVDGGVMAK